MKRPIDWREDRSAVREKVAESAHCVLPIVLIVVLLCLTAAPMKPDLLLSFLIGGVMLVVGMGLFSLGAEQSMTPIGTKIGTALTRTKNLPLILGVSFALGFAITVGRAGPAGAGGNGAAHQQHGTSADGRRGRRPVYGRVHAAHRHGREPALAADRLLCAHLPAGRLFRPRFSRNCL